MRRVGKAIAALLAVGCSSAPARPGAGGGAPISAVIYRDGDARIAAEPRSMNRPDGDVVALAAPARRPPAAMVVVRRAVDLGEGAASIALPEIGDAAAPGSIWVRRIAGPGTLAIERIHRPPSIVEPRALRGRAVVARVGGERIAGTLVDVDRRGALLSRGGKLVVLPAQVLELPGAGRSKDAPIRADVVAERPGRYLIEVAYQTAALSWSLDLHLEVTRVRRGAPRITLSPVIAVQNRGPALAGARVELFAGRYDDDRSPARSIWRGRLDLGAGETRRALPARTVEGALELRYRGFFGDRPGGEQREGWGTASTEIVEQVLRLPPGSLPPAAAIAHVAITGDGPDRLHRVPIAEPAADGSPIDLVLGAITDVRGTRRQLWVKSSGDGAVITEAYELAVLNRSAQTRVVRVSEPLARSGEVELVELPGAAQRVGDNLEVELVVGPQAREAIQYVARYRLRR